VIQYLPALNALLNAIAAILLVRGYMLIKAGRRDEHRKTMLVAFGVSVVFLASYLVHHAFAGLVLYQKTGLIHGVYLTILFTHTSLAATVPVLAIITLRRGLKANAGKGTFARHRAIARWTFPIWLYVSVTGVVVYFMLYRF
jgi:uncharacterized membrane protein YozB (DUF420 family)